MKRSCLLGFALGMAAWPALAYADLTEDVRALSSAHAGYGQVIRLKPRLLERGERLPLAIPPALLDPKDSSCTTVTVLGVPGSHFVVRFSSFDPGAPSSAFPETSSAGASEITRCGSSKPFLNGVALEMRSPRGLIETLVSNAKAGLPHLIEILPSRDPGTELPLGDPGPRPAPAPLAQRLKRLSARAQRENARTFASEQAQAGEDGTGALPLALVAGCHELTLLADVAASAATAVDLDLELVDLDSGARLGIDRADDADGALSVCLGVATSAELRFIGATPRAPLTLTHALWDLPLGLPTNWGPEPRAHLAHLAQRDHLRLPKQPIYSSLGVQGTTELPLEVEPGACYSAFLTPLRGDVRNLSLSAVAHSPGETPRGATDTDGCVVSFCAQGARHATLEVTGDGANLAWLVAIWDRGRSAIGVRAR